MNKTIRRSVIITLVFVFATVSVFGAMGGFKPLKDGGYVKVYNGGKYREDKGTVVGNNGLSPSSGNAEKQAIIPKDRDYVLQVVSAGGSKSSRISGTIMDNKTVEKTAASIQGGINNSFWFNMSKNPGSGVAHPMVTYTGYKVWSPNEGKYIPLKITYEVVDWNRNYRASNDSKNPYNKGKYRAVIGIGKSFKGMPDVDLVNIGAAAMKITFIRTDTNNPYDFKYSFTYKDIDCWQAIGINTRNSGGFTVHSDAVNNLLYSSTYQSTYNVISSNNKDDMKPTDKRYWASFNVDVRGGTLGMVYASNQKDGNKKDAPNGRHSYFEAKNYTPAMPPPFSAPKKYVCDETKSNDVNRNSPVHNRVTGRDKGKKDQEFFYNIHLTVPPGLTNDRGSLADWTSLSFTDTFDKCISVDDTGFDWTEGAANAVNARYFSGKKYVTKGANNWQAFTDSGVNIKSGITLKVSGNKCTWTLNTGDTGFMNKIYSGGKAGGINIIVPCHFSATQEAMIQHHGLVSGKFIDVSNDVTATVKYAGATETIKEQSNTVKTRIKKIFRKNLLIKKKLTGINYSNSQPFSFKVKINGKGSYAYTITGGSTASSGTITAGTAKDVKLTANQTMTIKDIPEGVKYTITEGKVALHRAKVEQVKHNGGYGADSSTPGGWNTYGALNTSLKITGKAKENDNNIVYEVTNERVPYKHTLTINKKVIGTAGSGYTVRVRFYDGFVDVNALTAQIVNQSGPGTVAKDIANKVITFSGIGNGTKMVIGNIPDDAYYTVSEDPSPGVKASYTATPNVKGLLNSITGTAGRGNGISTPTQADKRERFKSGTTGKPKTLPNDYGIEYTLKNDSNGKHNVVITKTLSGNLADNKDTFSYVASFTNIPAEEGAYYSFGGKITDGSTVVKPLKSERLAQNRYDMPFTIRAGQTVTFMDVTEGTHVTVKELKNDYRPSLVYTNSSGNDVAAQGEVNKDLSATSVMPSGDQLFRFAFNNDKNWEPDYHDVVVNKVVSGDGADPDQSFDFTANFTNIPVNKLTNAREPFSGEIKQGDNVIRTINTGDIDGAAHQEEFRLKNGQQLVFHKVPAGTTVNITEARNNQNYQPKVDYKTTSGNTTQKSGGIGQALTASVVLPENKEVFTFNYTNTKEVPPSDHTVTVSKAVAGNKADPNDSFRFTAAFSDIPEPQEGSRKTFAGEIWQGPTLVERFEPEALGSASYTKQFQLKDGQQIRFTGIPGNVKVEITEAASAYVPHLEYTRADGTIDVKDEESGKTLSAEVELPEISGSGSQFDFDYTNTKGGPDPDTYSNLLRIGKIATDGTSDPFDFTANLKGLKPGVWYAAAATRGNTTYRLVSDNSGIYALDTNTNRKVKGVAFTLVRGDGKTQAFTANEDGIVPREEYAGWAGNVSGGLDIIWVGGRVRAPRYKYAMFNEDEGSLSFIETTFNYENGYYDGDNIYYKGFENLTGTAAPLWADKLDKICTVNFLTEVSPKTLYKWFACPYLESISGIYQLRTGNATNMAQMFAGAADLDKIDVSTFDTGKVTSMESMFQGCETVSVLNVAGFDTSKVTTMKNMFADCKELSDLNTAGFDTGAVTDMTGMFSGCTELSMIDLSYANTSRVTKMDSMFAGCGAVESIFVSNRWGVSAVTSSANMFEGCTSIEGYDPAAAKDKTKAFYGEGGYLINKFEGTSKTPEAGLCYRDPQAYEEPDTSAGTFRGTITPFLSNGSGAAEVTMQNADHDTVTIDGLPSGASYKVREAGSTYVPSYSGYRDGHKTMSDEGQKTRDLVTKEKEFDTEVRTEDLVEYVNSKNSFNLKVTKVTEGDLNKKFNFVVDVSGLHEEEYSIRIPGTKNSTLTMDNDGNINITVASGSPAGIPVKLSRPLDGNTKTMYTDSAGKIARTEFEDWLTEEQTESFTFSIQWPGGETEGKFEVEE